ncbi:MAG: hypothetical protein JWR10_1385 [Rubritepida sp.]|nr:hypothetical protein [Rubritepida sp.]
MAVQFPVILEMISHLRKLDGIRASGTADRSELFELWDKLDVEKQALLLEMARLMSEAGELPGRSGTA